MISLYDFTNCKASSRNLEYGGRAGEKKGIIFDNSFWILKFPKSTFGMKNIKNLSYVTSPLNEYIGCHIFEILGYDVQKTILGISSEGKNTKVVCACKDFISDTKREVLLPYTSLRNDISVDVIKKDYEESPSASNIKEIIFQLKHNSVLKELEESTERFWDMVVIDMLINNNDRNEDNWGVIKNRETNSYRLAPIYDCGNSFYGKTSDERILEILSNKDKLYDCSMNGLTAFEDPSAGRISNAGLLSLNIPELREALFRVKEKVTDKLYDIIDFIYEIPETFNDVEIISRQRKEFYIETFKIRFEKQIQATTEDIKAKLRK